MFAVTATGEGTLSYQWQKDQVNLSNGGHYSGCTTATLTVSNVDSSDEADYRCVVTDDCGSTNSDEAALVIDMCGSAFSLENGYFDDSTSGWTVASGWTSYSSGAPVFYKNTSIVQSSPNAQRIRPPSSGASAYAGVYQNVAASEGDAITDINP